MMNVDEQTYLVGKIVINDGTKDINVANINANLSNSGNSFNLSINILDKELVKLYPTEVDNQLNEFYDLLKQKLVDNGYSISIR